MNLQTMSYIGGTCNARVLCIFAIPGSNRHETFCQNVGFFMAFLHSWNILWKEGGQSFEMILAWLRLVVVLASQLVESSPTSSLLLFLPALHIVRFLKNCCRTVEGLFRDYWRTVSISVCRVVSYIFFGAASEALHILRFLFMKSQFWKTAVEPV